jgi:tRNA 2-thiouridine synthesizing protein A
MAESIPTARPAAGEASPTPPAADRYLDCKGLLCPLPVYRVAQAMADLTSGQVLHVECTDPGSLKDFEAFARQRGHTLLSAETRGEVQVFFLRKEGEQ